MIFNFRFFNNTEAQLGAPRRVGDVIIKPGSNELFIGIITLTDVGTNY